MRILSDLSFPLSMTEMIVLPHAYGEPRLTTVLDRVHHEDVQDRRRLP